MIAHAKNQSLHSEKIRVRGLVQGVGFRPTVWKFAHKFNLKGEVINDGSGVLITVQSDPILVEKFIHLLQQQPPKLARIDKIERQLFNSKQTYSDFKIKESVGGEIKTGIVADASTCIQCLDDITNEKNRRLNYPFTNCTHCGPRLSIIKDIPYDRVKTSMSDFKLCEACLKEYQDPSDRRFHAQPNACNTCGPKIYLADSNADVIKLDNPISESISLLKQGKIIAIKGIGGFQLACDANNDESVNLLRQRKNRPSKPLALMAKNIEMVRSYCEISIEEKELLKSTPSPIVLLKKAAAENLLPESIAPNQNHLGFMLPNTPIHHLIFTELEFPIVLTSGNLVNEPQCIDNQQAFNKLNKIADYFLFHDRDIINRIDDSVVRVINRQTHFLRRARGYAPSPIKLPLGFEKSNDIFACGGELKNTFCLIKDGEATLSQHIGNLENLQSYEDYIKNIDLYNRLFQFKPEQIVVDQHPEYLSSKYGRQLAEENQLMCHEIQHHHAHIASCLADNSWAIDQGKVIGIALDGLGYGDDSTLWGGEVLIADYTSYERKAKIKLAPMIGGVQAIMQPWRNTYAQLTTHFRWQELQETYPELELLEFLSTKPTTLLNQMIDSNLNTPMSSSCGRLFDSVAAAIGICREEISYEGQAAIELESAIQDQDFSKLTPYPFNIDAGEMLEINPKPFWTALLNDLSEKRSRSEMSAKFHLGLVTCLTERVVQIREQTGISDVVFSGGVFQNKTLFTLCKQQLSQQKINILFHRQVPSNDGGLSLGQAVIAAAKTIYRD